MEKLSNLTKILAMGFSIITVIVKTNLAEQVFGINVPTIHHNPGLKYEACSWRFWHDVHPVFQYIY